MIWRLVFMAAVAIGSPLRAEVSDSIKPGVILTAAEMTLQKFGYHTDEKFKLDVMPRDVSHGLAFSQIDEATTLVLGYRLSTKEIDSIGVTIIPERKPKLLRSQVDLPVLEVKFEDDGVYSLKLKRGAAKDDVLKGASIQSVRGEGHAP
jgi:hypothetical protein